MTKVRQTSNIDDKIKIAQDNVVRTKTKYDTAIADLKQLLDKKMP